jgi:hypothetical protein
LNGLSSIVHSNRPLPRTDSCDGLEALTPREWMTSSERHQANTKSQMGVRTSVPMRRTGGNARHRWTRVHRLHSSRLLVFSASSAFGSSSAAFVTSSHLLRIVSIRLVSSSCPHRLGIRLVSSSSPHRLHSVRLLIFSASSALVSSLHLLLPRWGVGSIAGNADLPLKSGLEWSGVPD